ncbi:hypothetical protein [Aureimonas pseudogalii]|uniref:Uncharacterized protein n=1 Tax=Aureimonas pseudogalii TaxID=1744844 RepID=A0A7W6H5D0_9HYPH|nr:hypothetical protein [Aureimonas pseudogalii]MBB3998870.1 hypothetical protein [Aureimonas pseudogalii]
MPFTLTEAAAIIARLYQRPADDILGLARRLKNFEARGRIEALPERGPRDAALLDESELPLCVVLSAACDAGFDGDALRAIENACYHPFDWTFTTLRPDRLKQNGVFVFHGGSALETAYDGVLCDEPWVLRLVLMRDECGRPMVEARIEPDEGEAAVAVRVLTARLASEGRTLEAITRMPLNTMLLGLAYEIRASQEA